MPTRAAAAWSPCCRSPTGAARSPTSSWTSSSKCTLCGQCDVSCKVCRYDMWILDGAREFRHYLNEKGDRARCLPRVIDQAAREPAIWPAHRRPAGRLGRRSGPQEAAAPGARSVPRQGRRPVPRRLPLLVRPEPDGAPCRRRPRCSPEGGLDFALDGDEGCCGGKAYDMGYRDDFDATAEANLAKWADAGVKTIVTPCATCFWTFKRLYPKRRLRTIEVLHTTRAADRLMLGGQAEADQAGADEGHLSRSLPSRPPGRGPRALGRQGDQDLRPGGGLRSAAAALRRRLRRVRPAADGSKPSPASSWWRWSAPRKRPGAAAAAGRPAGLSGLRGSASYSAWTKPRPTGARGHRHSVLQLQPHPRQRSGERRQHHEGHRRARAGRAGSLEEGRRNHGSLQ